MGTGGSLIVIDFTEAGNSAWFRDAGWSEQEPDRIWGIGPRTVLLVPFQPSDRTLVLEAEISPARMPPDVTGQIVRIRINGTLIGHVRIGSRSLIRCEVAPALIREDGVQELAFEFPGFFCPGWFVENGDERALSGWFSFVRLYTTDMFKPGPWFPASRPDIPIIELSPPFDDAQGGEIRGGENDAAVFHTFGPNGSAVPFQRDGWDAGEDDFTWTVAASSHLELPAPRAGCSYVMRLDASPLIVRLRVRRQNVTVLLDGIVIGRLAMRETGCWILPLPRELTDGQDVLKLSFMLPNAVRPTDLGPSSDTRMLGVAVTRIGIIPLPPNLPFIDCIRVEQAGPVPPLAVSNRFMTEDPATLPGAIQAACGLNTVTLARGFESLGTDREFGIVQGKLGFEVFNLFRSCDIALPDLVRALTDDLGALTDPDAIAVEPSDASGLDHMLKVGNYNLRVRLRSGETAVDRDATARDHAVTLGYLRRKFYEGLRAGRKIYVLRHRRTILVSEAAAVLSELHRHGPATLLCVEPALDDQRPGEVELLAPGLMRGYVKRSASDTAADDSDSVAWLRVLGNAALLHREFNVT